jgi:hypothetical protein
MKFHGLASRSFQKPISCIMLLTPILAWEMVSRKLSPHPCLSAGREIGCAFFVTFFAQAKKVE